MGQPAIKRRGTARSLGLILGDLASTENRVDRVQNWIVLELPGQPAFAAVLPLEIVGYPSLAIDLRCNDSTWADARNSAKTVQMAIDPPVEFDFATVVDYIPIDHTVQHELSGVYQNISTNHSIERHVRSDAENKVTCDHAVDTNLLMLHGQFALEFLSNFSHVSS